MVRQSKGKLDRFRYSNNATDIILIFLDTQLTLYNLRLISGWIVNNQIRYDECFGKV